MSLTFTKSFTLLSMAIGALSPLMVAQAAGEPNPVTSSQYYPQPSETTASHPTDEVVNEEDTPPATAAKTSVARKPTKTRYKDGYKDQPQAPSLPWNGPFIGAFAGGAWGNTHLNSNAGVVTSSSYFSSSTFIRSINQNGTGTVMPRNAIGGIQVGNNVQSGTFVYGMVIDASSFRMNGDKSASGITFPTTAVQYTLKTSMTTSWLASLRARVGYAAEDWPYLYMTGGVAITNIHVSNTYGDDGSPSGMGGSSNTKVKPGWVIGAGIEIPVYRQWTMDGEYQFVNFGSNTANGFITCRSAACSGIRSPFSTSANLSAQMVRIGVNYKLA